MPPVAELGYDRADADRLTLEGTFEGEAIAVRLRRVPPPSWALTSREFRWVDDRPFQR